MESKPSLPFGFRKGLSAVCRFLGAAAIGVGPVLAHGLPRVRCLDYFAGHAQAEFGYPDLPAFDSRVFQNFAQQVRDQIDQNRSYALLDLREYFPPELGRALWALRGESSEVSVYADRERGLFVDDRPSYRRITSDQRKLFALLDRHERWFTRLLVHALGSRISIPFVESEARLQTAEANRGGQRWHYDGEAAGVRVILLIYGQIGTAIRLGLTESLTAPQGHALIIFGRHAQPDSTLRPTLHRNPPGSGDRAVLFQTYSHSRDGGSKRPSSTPQL